MKYIKLLLFFSSTFLYFNATFQQGSTQKDSGIEKYFVADSTIKIDAATGLKIGEGLELVTAHCTGCHSSKLITQFHTDRNGWLEKIRWMQQKQKLWDLGAAEPIILDYLAKNYPPYEKSSRRGNLKNIQWYNLNIK